MTSDDPDTPSPAPKISPGFQLIRDICAGRVSHRDAGAYYAVAAEAAERSPEAAAGIEKLADDVAARNAGRVV